MSVSKVNVQEKIESTDHVEVIVDHTSESSPWKTLLKQPKIVGLALFANLGSLMYGYDNLSLSLCLSMPPFEQQFGQGPIQTPYGEAYVIPAYWQSLWGALAQISTAIGAFSIALISDRFGRRVAFMLAGAISTAGLAVLFVSATPGVFLAGKMINGVALGMALATGQTYISEIAPLKIRGILLSAYAFGLNVGLLIAASIAFSRITIMDSSAYKVLFAGGWSFAAAFLLCSWFIPESPAYLIKKGNIEAAGKVYALKTNNEEMAVTANAKESTYMDCFRGANWRRTRIVLYCNGLQQMVGATFCANAPYFLVSAGMSPLNVSMVVEIGMALGIVFVLFTFWLLGKFNRRTIVLVATSFVAVVFLVMGICGCFPNSTTALWIVGCTLIVVQAAGLGPATGPAQAIAAEVSSVRLRSKSQSIGFFFNYFWSCVWNVVVPYMFNPDQGNLGGKMGFIFMATSVIAVVVLFFELPETRDITYAELDHLFEKRTPTRQFKKAAAQTVTA